MKSFLGNFYRYLALFFWSHCREPFLKSPSLSLSLSPYLSLSFPPFLSKACTGLFPKLNSSSRESFWCCFDVENKSFLFLWRQLCRRLSSHHNFGQKKKFQRRSNGTNSNADKINCRTVMAYLRVRFQTTIEYGKDRANANALSVQGAAIFGLIFQVESQVLIGDLEITFIIYRVACFRSVVYSVTRCWSKNSPKVSKNAQKQPQQLLHKSEVLQTCPKSCQSFGILLLEILSPRIFKNRPIWSHWWYIKKQFIS